MLRLKSFSDIDLQVVIKDETEAKTASLRTKKSLPTEITTIKLLNVKYLIDVTPWTELESCLI